ncbi:hypothetical protein KVR01_000652 [Diaporthe batatas]|uniref:uncharacterized protein n=1 Tax=Diaporthe batatas TaxID=748121 RepID=UPI001D044F1E|nr:uncharacterized protein KVR01_000652 [Diaporthe batatas]KAG8169907.1 hypothetical protein KVR01_000652 [Diaporthe batatas]
MPPPKGTAGNILEGPGDYDVTSTVHCDPYPAIDPSHFDLLGKAVLITGASRGLGRAMVLAFAAAGASKIAAGARGDTASLRDAVNNCASANGHSKPNFLPLTLDVSHDASVAAAAAAITAEFGRLDIVINNAGVLGTFGKVGDTDPDQWWRVFQVNLLGPYLVSRAMIPLLREAEHSYLIHVSSGGAHLVNPGLSAYQTSKLALLRFSQLLHREYAETGVTSFAVHPGNCPTDIMGPGELDEFHKSIYTDDPALCAQSLVYLISEPRPWLGGRYVNCTWDLPELMAQKDAIVKGDKLKVKLDF